MQSNSRSIRDLANLILLNGGYDDPESCDEFGFLSRSCSIDIIVAAISMINISISMLNRFGIVVNVNVNINSGIIARGVCLCTKSNNSRILLVLPLNHSLGWLGHHSESKRSNVPSELYSSLESISSQEPRLHP